jgi:outer membrane protein OmpA-like peptidoglycan-associated protein
MPLFAVNLMRLTRLCATTLFLLSFISPLSAQSLTDEELLQMFQKQRDAFRAAQQSDTGKTRGLTLVTVDNVNVSTESPNLTAPAAGDVAASISAASSGGVTVGTVPLASLAPAPDQAIAPQQSPEATPVVFGDLAPELQINVHIKFNFDSAALTPDQKPLLAQLCTVMRGSDIQKFRIIGHTDSSGPEEYNQKLSQLRANEVQRYLVKDCGIAAQRIEAVGLGERFLADKADPKAAENRRVEFQALS